MYFVFCICILYLYFVFVCQATSSESQLLLVHSSRQATCVKGKIQIPSRLLAFLVPWCLKRGRRYSSIFTRFWSPQESFWSSQESLWSQQGSLWSSQESRPDVAAAENHTGRLFPTTNCQEEKIQNLAKLIYIFHKIPNSDWVSDSVEADQKGFQHLFCFQLFPGLAFYSCLLMHQLMSVRIWRGFTEIKAFPGAARNSHGNSTDRQGGLGKWVQSDMGKLLHWVVVSTCLFVALGKWKAKIWVWVNLRPKVSAFQKKELLSELKRSKRW